MVVGVKVVVVAVIAVVLVVERNVCSSYVIGVVYDSGREE